MAALFLLSKFLFLLFHSLVQNGEMDTYFTVATANKRDKMGIFVIQLKEKEFHVLPLHMIPKSLL